MALLEKEATRFAESLEDYEHVTVVDIGGWGPDAYWVVVRDQRFDTEYEIASHCDYWDFIGALVDHKQYIGRVVDRVVIPRQGTASGRGLEAATPAAEASVPDVVFDAAERDSHDGSGYSRDGYRCDESEKALSEIHV